MGFRPGAWIHSRSIINLGMCEARIRRERIELFSLEHHAHRNDKSIPVEEWVMRSLSIVLTESRLIVVVTSILSLCVTLFLLEKIPISETYLAILFVALLPNVLGAALTSIIYFGKRISIRDNDFAAFRMGWLIGLEETSPLRVFPLKSEEINQSPSESDDSSSNILNHWPSIISIDDDLSLAILSESSCSSDDSKSTDYYNLSMQSSCDDNISSYNSNSHISFNPSADSNDSMQWKSVDDIGDKCSSTATLFIDLSSSTDEKEDMKCSDIVVFDE